MPTNNNIIDSVTNRSPNAGDSVGYAVGHVWRAPNGSSVPWWNLGRAAGTSPAQDPVWQPSSSFDGPPADAAPAAVALYGSKALRAAWTGNLFDVTRVSDQTTKTFSVWQNGCANLAAIGSFLNGATGYVTKIYDQSGNAHDITQTVLASAPRLDLTIIRGGAPAFVADWSFRFYLAGQNTGSSGYVVTSFSGAVLTMAAPLSYWFAPGYTVTGTNIPANTVITALNFTNNTITLSNALTGAVGPITLGNAAVFVFMDLPVGVAVTYNAHSLFVAMTPPVNGLNCVPITVGCTAEIPLSSSQPSSSLIIGGNSLVANMRVYAQDTNAFIYQIPTASFHPFQQPSIYGFTRNVKAINWWGQESSGSGATTSDPGTSTLTNGSLFWGQQFNGNIHGGDMELFGASIYNSVLSATQVPIMIQAFDDWLDIKPQVRKSIMWDGSSTTAGNGGPYTFDISRRVSERLWPVYNSRAFNAASGGGPEVSQFNFPNFYAPYINPALTSVLIFHCGLGNALQATGNVNLNTALQSGATLTIATGASLANSNFVPHVIVTGTNVPAGTSIVSVTTTTITLSAVPTGLVSALNVSNDTGALAWANTILYLQAARAAGIPKLILVGSATRGSFTSTQLQEFRNAKNLFALNWPTVADAYIDLEQDPAFGADTPMTVINVSGNNVTVSALSTFAAMGNYVTWVGATSPAAFITGIAGHVLTLSQTPPGGLTTIHALNPTPWVTYPAYWNPDHQHFTPLGYEVHATLEYDVLVSGGFLS